MTLRPGVTIDSGPSAWQILQQDDRGCARITLSGRWAPRSTDDLQHGPHWVEARLVYESSGCPVSVHLDWTRAEMGREGRWNITLKDIPAGGLYRVETRVSRRNLPDERPLRGDYIHCLGVGDLWCIAGQSNASGTGAGIVEDGPELGVHLFGNDEQWKLATHPLEDATGTRHPITITGIYHGHSPWLTFAKHVKRMTGIPIGLIPTGLGGSPLSLWNPEEGRAILYQNMMDMVRKAGGRVRGILWYQGESDCTPTLARNYGVRFRQFVESLRRDLGMPELPILTAQINRTTTPILRLSPSLGSGMPEETHRAWSLVRESQRQAGHDISALYVIPTLDLALSDNIHNSAPAEVILGERFAQVALGRVYGRKALDCFPEVVEARFANDARDEVTLRFDHVTGGWCALGPVEDFRVEDAEGVIPIKEVILGEEGKVRLRLSRPGHSSVLLHLGFGANPTVNLRDGNQRPPLAFSVPIPYQR